MAYRTHLYLVLCIAVPAFAPAHAQSGDTLPPWIATDTGSDQPHNQIARQQVRIAFSDSGTHFVTEQETVWRLAGTLRLTVVPAAPRSRP